MRRFNLRLFSTNKKLYKRKINAWWDQPSSERKNIKKDQTTYCSAKCLSIGFIGGCIFSMFFSNTSAQNSDVYLTNVEETNVQDRSVKL